MNHKTDSAALILRVALGVMFLAHGLTKLLVFTPAGTAQFFASIGFPSFLAYFIIAFEILAGIFLILGVFTRWVSLLATVQLFVAATVHFGNGWAFGNSGGGWEYPVFLSASALALYFLGDGTWSLSHLLCRKSKRK